MVIWPHYSASRSPVDLLLVKESGCQMLALRSGSVGKRGRERERGHVHVHVHLHESLQLVQVCHSRGSRRLQKRGRMIPTLSRHFEVRTVSYRIRQYTHSTPHSLPSMPSTRALIGPVTATNSFSHTFSLLRACGVNARPYPARDPNVRTIRAFAVPCLLSNASATPVLFKLL